MGVRWREGSDREVDELTVVPFRNPQLAQEIVVDLLTAIAANSVEAVEVEDLRVAVGAGDQAVLIDIGQRAARLEIFDHCIALVAATAAQRTSSQDEAQRRSLALVRAAHHEASFGSVDVVRQETEVDEGHDR